MVQLVVIDGHPMLSFGLHEALKSISDLEVAGVAEGFGEAIKLIRLARPEIAVVDIAMCGPRCDGIQLVTGIRKIAPDTRIVVFTDQIADIYIKVSAELGVEGYILKTEPVPMVIESVRSVLNGGVVYSRGVHNVLTGNVGSSRPALTRREAEILQLAANGLETMEIANSLAISRTTVQQALTTSYQKLNADNRLDAVLKAARHGLVAIRA